MGATGSRFRSDSSRVWVNRTNSNRRRISSLLVCGCTPSRASREIEEHSDEIRVSSSRVSDPAISIVQKPSDDFSLEVRGGTEHFGTDTETGTSSESHSWASLADASSNIEANMKGKCLTKADELLNPSQVSEDPKDNESHRERISCVASTSFRERQSPDIVSVNVAGIMDETSNLVNLVTDENHFDEVRFGIIDNPGTVSDPHVSGIQGSSVLPRHLEEPSGFTLSHSERGEEHGIGNSAVAGDILSDISSGSSSRSINHEQRGNRRRQFSDAFSVHGSRRLIEYPSAVFSGNNIFDRGAHGRWLLNLDDDVFDGVIRGDPGYRHDRSHTLNEGRWLSRSEIWGRLQSATDESEQRRTLCPFGVHSDSSCSCESFLMNDESSIHASISRIVMLAEALFEVLDEFHHQPGSLASLPAPESVVDSFPLKNHKKIGSVRHGDDVQQCYICLSEYEDGDRIRVLPCKHEYHMSCVDKWLKEIHGICPLCRGDVTEALTEGWNSGTPSFS